MAKIDTQNIPAELLDQYIATLGEANLWKETERVRKKYPWRLPQMTGPNCISGIMKRGAGVTPFQDAHRKLFCRSGRCYNGQPYSGGATPPNLGARNRSWWYTAAGGSGQWYYNYFMQQTINAYLAANIPDWCYIPPQGDTYADEGSPNQNYGSQPDAGCRRYLPGAGDSKIIFITRPIGARELLFFIWSVASDVFQPAGSWFGVYEITEPVDESTLTWNNMPPLGKLLTTFHLQSSWPWVKKWKQIYIPGDHDIAIFPTLPLQPPFYNTGMAIITKDGPPTFNWPPYWIY